jgi:hypothetical protein
MKGLEHGSLGLQLPRTGGAADLVSPEELVQQNRLVVA